MGVRKPGKGGVVVPMERISQAILLIRGHKVMLDSDLAELYGVATKVLIQAVKRNGDRFPEDFMFQLSSEEFDRLRHQIGTSSLRSQIVTSNPVAERDGTTRGGRRYPPYAFTEQGVAMLSSVLHSNRVPSHLFRNTFVSPNRERSFQ